MVKKERQSTVVVFDVKSDLFVWSSWLTQSTFNLHDKKTVQKTQEKYNVSFDDFKKLKFHWEKENFGKITFL